MCRRGNRPVAVGDWGYPGYLTRHEWEVFVSFFFKMEHISMPALQYYYISHTLDMLYPSYSLQQQFRAEVERRPPEFQSTVFSFAAAAEDPSYALCRWLRARKYHLSQALTMVAEATECRQEPGRHAFYSDGHAALGVEPSVYHAQYPQMYYGYAAGGHPLFISRVGRLNAEGVSCVTTMDGILRYHWHDMMHSYVKRLDRQRRKSDGSFKRCEVVCIIDLEGLTTGHITKRALDIIQKQTEIDSLCFPETLRRLVIINAPGFFALTWNIIKKWIDARTAEKICILGNNRSKWTAALRELVDDPDQLPVDFGGTGKSIERYLEQEAVEQYNKVHTRGSSIPRTSSFCPKTLAKGQIVSQKAYHFSVRSAASHHASVLRDESMELSVFTRSLAGGTLRITSPSGVVVATVSIRHNGKEGGNDPPTRLDLDVVLAQPGRYKFKIESNGGSLFGTEDFVLATRVFGTTTDDHHLRLAASNSNANLDVKPSDSPSNDLGTFVDSTLRFCEGSEGDVRTASPLMAQQGQNKSMLDIDLSTDEREQEDELPPLHPRDIGLRRMASLPSRPQSPNSTAGSTSSRTKTTTTWCTNMMDDRQPSPSEALGVSERVDGTEGEIEDEEGGTYCTGMPGMLCGALGGSTASLSTFFDLLCGGGSADALGRTESRTKDTLPVPIIATSTSSTTEDYVGMPTMASF